MPERRAREVCTVKRWVLEAWGESSEHPFPGEPYKGNGVFLEEALDSLSIVCPSFTQPTAVSQVLDEITDRAPVSLGHLPFALGGETQRRHVVPSNQERSNKEIFF